MHRFRSGDLLRSGAARLLITAAILGGASPWLAAGSARAADYSCAPLSAGGPGGFLNLPFSTIRSNDRITCGDKLFTIGSFDVGGNLGSVVFEWVQTDPPPGYTGDKFSLNLLFVPSQTGPRTGFFNYTLAITDPAYQFANVQLDSTVAVSTNPLSPGDTIVSKDIDGIPMLESINGAQVGPVAFSLPSPISISDTWSVAANDVLTSIKDTYQQQEQHVPGPLPLMGAGMAFGFSRRLRRRLRAKRNQRA